jgi:hypothetical protein
VAWPQETAQVEPHGGDGLGETPEGVWPRPGARRHDTWVTARTQHGTVGPALALSMWPVLSPSTDLRPPGSVTAIMGARPQGIAAQREARDSAGVFRHNTWAGDTPGSIAWTL